MKTAFSFFLAIFFVVLLNPASADMTPQWIHNSDGYVLTQGTLNAKNIPESMPVNKITSMFDGNGISNRFGVFIGVAEIRVILPEDFLVVDESGMLPLSDLARFDEMLAGLKDVLVTIEESQKRAGGWVNMTLSHTPDKPSKIGNTNMSMAPRATFDFTDKEARKAITEVLSR